MADPLNNKIFQDATKARAWLESLLWADGRVCGYCGVVNESTAIAGREGYYQCNACRKQFTVQVGTLFERSHIPLNKWLMAAFLLCASKKGMSAHQMHRMLGITYKSAWFMCHRLREAMAPGGAVEALRALRDSGVVEHIGVAAGDVALMRQLVATDLFDVVLNHNRYTLVDRSAEPLIDDAVARGVAFVNAAPYGGGILSKGPAARSTYGYRDADGVVLERVRAMQAACDKHGVPLAAAALQFSLREPRVTSTVVGVSSPERIAETVALAQLSVPAELWDELGALTPPAEHWLP